LKNKTNHPSTTTQSVLYDWIADNAADAVSYSALPEVAPRHQYALVMDRGVLKCPPIKPIDCSTECPLNDANCLSQIDGNRALVCEGITTTDVLVNMNDKTEDYYSETAMVVFCFGNAINSAFYALYQKRHPLIPVRNLDWYDYAIAVIKEMQRAKISIAVITSWVLGQLLDAKYFGESDVIAGYGKDGLTAGKTMLKIERGDFLGASVVELRAVSIALGRITRTWRENRVSRLVLPDDRRRIKEIKLALADELSL